MLKKHKFSISFFLWMGAVTVLSLLPLKEAPKIEFTLADKIVHFAFYFLACVLGVFFIREKFQSKFSVIQGIIMMALFTVFYGILIEILQHTVTVYRKGDVYDALANSIGAIIGSLFLFWLFKKSSLMKWNN